MDQNYRNTKPILKIKDKKIIQDILIIDMRIMMIVDLMKKSKNKWN